LTGCYGHEKIKTRILTLYLFARIGVTKIETLPWVRGKTFRAQYDLFRWRQGAMFVPSPDDG
jgi:hypothetical protein